MKTIFCITFFLLGMNCFSQSVIQEWPLSVTQKGVEIMEQKSPRGSLTRYSYDRDGFLIGQVYKNRGKIQTNTIIRYQKTDESLIVRTDEILNNYEKEENYDKSVKKFFFDSEGRYSRFEIYASEKITKPYVVADNFVYEGDLLISYDRNKYSKNDKTSTTQMLFKYNEKEQLIQIHFCEPNSNDDSFIVYQYNGQGQLTDRIKIIPNYLGTFNASSLLGNDFKSEQRMSKRHISYSDFDAYGNWTKSVTILDDGRKKAGYTRKFKYYQ